MSLAQINGHTFFSNRMDQQARVLDLGANRGAFAQGVVRQFGCRCVCVEPAADLCRAIEQSPRLEVMNVAVAARSGHVSLHLSANSEESSLLSIPSGARSVGAVDVEALTFAACLDRIGGPTIDLVKMDIEGAEIGVIDSSPDEVLKAVPQFTIEFHDFNGMTPRLEIMRVAGRMRRIGFSMLNVWGRSHGDVVFVQRAKVGVTLFEFLVAKYWLRNWWGLRRVLARNARWVTSRA